MRNALLTTISERATGAIVTGALVGITAAAQSVNGATASALRTLQTNESSDEDPDPSAVPAATSADAGVESVAGTDSRSSTPLSPIPESPAARSAEKVVITDIGTGTDRDGKNSGSFVEARVNAIEKSELIASDVSTDAIPDSEMTNQSEPTGLNVDEIKFTKIVTVLNGRKYSHVHPPNTETNLVTVTNSTAAIQALAEHTGPSSNLGSPDDSSI